MGRDYFGWRPQPDAKAVGYWEIHLLASRTIYRHMYADGSYSPDDVNVSFAPPSGAPRLGLCGRSMFDFFGITFEEFVAEGRTLHSVVCEGEDADTGRGVLAINKAWRAAHLARLGRGESAIHGE